MESAVSGVGREGGTSDTHRLDVDSFRNDFLVYGAISKKNVLDQ